MIHSMNTPINPAATATAFSGTTHLPAGPSRPRRLMRALGGLGMPVFLLAVCIGCFRFLDEKKGSGTIATDQRAIEGEFEGVALLGFPTLNIVVEEGADVKLSITTDDNLLGDVNTTVKDGVLVIDTEDNLAPTRGISIDLKVPRLSSVRLTGSGDINAQGIEGESFKATLTGSGDINLRGECEVIELAVTGSGDLGAQELTARNATAKVTGSGDIVLSARESADCRVTGSGDITLRGKPANLSRSVTGSGDIRVSDNTAPERD